MTVYIVNEDGVDVAIDNGKGDDGRYYQRDREDKNTMLCIGGNGFVINEFTAHDAPFSKFYKNDRICTDYHDRVKSMSATDDLSHHLSDIPEAQFLSKLAEVKGVPAPSLPGIIYARVDATSADQFAENIIDNIAPSDSEFKGPFHGLMATCIAAISHEGFEKTRSALEAAMSAPRDGSDFDVSGEISRALDAIDTLETTLMSAEGIREVVSLKEPHRDAEAKPVKSAKMEY